MSRRAFLTGAAGLAVAAGTASSAMARTVAGDPAPARPRPRLPRPQDAPFDTVVVLMMENRSFDHLLGWLPGRERGSRRG